MVRAPLLSAPSNPRSAVAEGTGAWATSYSGNLPNNNGTTHNTACTDTNEDVVVTTVPSALTSADVGAE